MFIEEENNNIIDAQEVEVVPQKKDNSDYVMKLPDSEKEEPEIQEPNKAPFWAARVAGGLIDLCLVFLATLGLYTLFVNSGMGNKLRSLSYDMVYIQDHYKLDDTLVSSGETYGYKIYSYEEEYEEKLAGHQVYAELDTGFKYIIVDYKEHSQALTDAYVAAVKNDQIYKNDAFDYNLINYGIIALAGFISETVFVLVIPLTNRRRATLGKFAAGTQVINHKYEVEAKWYQILFRYLWIFLVESALPYLFMSTYTIFVMPVVMLVFTFFNKDRRTIHDFVTRTKVIDVRSFKRLEEQD